MLLSQPLALLQAFGLMVSSPPPLQTSEDSDTCVDSQGDAEATKLRSDAAEVGSIFTSVHSCTSNRIALYWCSTSTFHMSLRCMILDQCSARSKSAVPLTAFDTCSVGCSAVTSHLHVCITSGFQSLSHPFRGRNPMNHFLKCSLSS